MESAMSGIVAAKNMFRYLQGKPALTLPADTMCGALSRYISDETVTDFQPMGANMGILPPLNAPVRDKKERYRQLAERALASLDRVLRQEGEEE